MSNADQVRAHKPAGLASLAAVFLLLCGLGCGQRVGKVDSNRYTALGEVMAAKTIELCKGRGNIVLLVCDTDNGRPTAYGQAIEAFRKSAGKSLKIIATESVETPAVLMRGFEPVSPEKLAELLGKYSAADCLVSFAGVPALTADQIARLPDPRPKVAAPVVFNPPAKAMFEGRVIYLAAFPASPPRADAPAEQTPQQAFDTFYQIITSENAVRLAD